MYAVNFSDLYVSFINANVIIGSSLFFIIYLFYLFIYFFVHQGSIFQHSLIVNAALGTCDIHHKRPVKLELDESNTSLCPSMQLTLIQWKLHCDFSPQIWVVKIDKVD